MFDWEHTCMRVPTKCFFSSLMLVVTSLQNFHFDMLTNWITLTRFCNRNYVICLFFNKKAKLKEKSNIFSYPWKVLKHFLHIQFDLWINLILDNLTFELTFALITRFCVLSTLQCDIKLISLPSSDFRGERKTIFNIIWVKVFKNGPSKLFDRQPLKNLKRYGLPKQTISLQIF